MKSFTDPMQPEKFYHLYNRGINGCDLFFAKSNYYRFMEKYARYTEKIVTTYAYSLLENHFHLLIKIKSEEEIRAHHPYMASKSIEEIVSKQFAHLFNGYAQYFNLFSQRTGKLFELPFRRKPVDSQDYLYRLIFYIHTNPQKHGLIDDFKLYPYSSFNSYISEVKTRLPREEVLKWFGGKEEYLRFHQQNIDLRVIEEMMIE